MLFDTVWYCLILFDAVWCCLMLFDAVWWTLKQRYAPLITEFNGFQWNGLEFNGMGCVLEFNGAYWNSMEWNDLCMTFALPLHALEWASVCVGVCGGKCWTVCWETSSGKSRYVLRYRNIHLGRDFCIFCIFAFFAFFCIWMGATKPAFSS